MSTVRKKSLAIGVAAALSLGGAFALGATAPTQAAPLSVNALALKEAAPENVTEVRRRWRRHRRGAAVAGLGAWHYRCGRRGPSVRPVSSQALSPALLPALWLLRAAPLYPQARCVYCR
jgi:hypothetical protein